VTDLLDYDDHYATLMDGIRYATGDGPQTPELAAEEALTRLKSDFPSLHFANRIDQTELRAVIVAAIEREKSGELSDDEAVHVALDGLRELCVPIGPRPPMIRTPTWVRNSWTPEPAQRPQGRGITP
jgi:hypothetical protein